MPAPETQFVPPRPSLAPRHWGGWLAVSVIWVLGHLPRFLGRWLVSPLAPLMRWSLASRRRIAIRNLQRCFPEWSDEQRGAVLRECFRSLARMLAEMAWCWAGSWQNLEKITDVTGAEHLQEAAESGQGVLILTAHVTCLEIGARAIGHMVEGWGVYRPLGNPVLEWYQNRGRNYYAAGMIKKHAMRSAVRHLRKGGVLWYAPDQDFGPDQSVFAPFFGVQAATLLATHRLPKMTACKVIAMIPSYSHETGRYHLEVSPVLENFPGDDPQQDLARVNAILEHQVRQSPGQYWWVHRRFKTRPPGEPDFYGRDSRT